MQLIKTMEWCGYLQYINHIKRPWFVSCPWINLNKRRRHFVFILFIKFDKAEYSNKVNAVFKTMYPEMHQNFQAKHSLKTWCLK